jgi:CHASE3 domain sensor protein
MGVKMDQSLVNWLLAGFGALIGFLLNAVWQAVKDLQKSDKDIAAKVADIEVLVAGDYVKKNEFQDNIKALFAKLDKIEDKIDRKVDK